MAQYQVKNNQNIFDIAIQLYGSIEGIYDLLISNEWLSMTTELKGGMLLEYHDYYITNEGIQSQIAYSGLIPANNERHVYYKTVDEALKLLIEVPVDSLKTEFSISGDGAMIIDWGDNSKIDVIPLSHIEKVICHYYDNEVDERMVKIYGNFNILHWDTSKSDGKIFTMSPVVVDEFTSTYNKGIIDGLALFSGTTHLNLQGMVIHDLSPIYNMYLQVLDLRNIRLDNIAIIDNYLENLVSNHGTRRDCTVYLSHVPSDVGMESINTIINEDSWNESGKWVFNINGTIYTAQ